MSGKKYLNTPWLQNTADDPKEIEKAAMIIRAYGHSTTETLIDTPWKEFIAGLSWSEGSF
jgi:hypothetical protein